MLFELFQRSVGLELVRFQRLGCETSKLSSQTLLAASLKSILAAGNMQATWGKGFVGTAEAGQSFREDFRCEG